jgi:hypothetical protein
MTINKSQRQSVAHVGLDLRNSVFTHGQFYVAISQVTSVHRLKAIWDSRLPTAKTKNIVYPEVIIDYILLLFFKILNFKSLFINLSIRSEIKPGVQGAVSLLLVSGGVVKTS